MSAVSRPSMSSSQRRHTIVPQSRLGKRRTHSIRIDVPPDVNIYQMKEMRQSLHTESPEPVAKRLRGTDHGGAETSVDIDMIEDSRSVSRPISTSN